MGRYSNIPTLTTPGGKIFKGTTKYPDIPLSFNDIYVYTDEGDRFDILAHKAYGDASLWWIIAIANPQFSQNSYYPPLGVQIRIPNNQGAILLQFNKLNGK